MNTAYQINCRQNYRAGKPVKSAAYLKFIRSLPCIACGGTRRMEAMHVGPRGLGQKVDDKDALPGCLWCHRELHDLGPVAFSEKYGLDFQALQSKLRLFFEQQLRGTY